MARPIKTGLDYFPMDTIWDRKMKIFKAKYKLAGIGLITELFKTIYSEGYFYPWDRDTRIIFADEHNIDELLLSEMVVFAIGNGLFSKHLFDKFNILSSSGIQKRYLNGALKRKRIVFHADFLLIKPELPEWAKGEIVIEPETPIIEPETGVIEPETPVKDTRSTQRKGKERKGKERKGKDIKEEGEQEVDPEDNTETLSLKCPTELEKEREQETDPEDDIPGFDKAPAQAPNSPPPEDESIPDSDNGNPESSPPAEKNKGSPSKKKENNERYAYKEIIDYLNLKVGAAYKASSNQTRKLIETRTKEGFTVDDFKRVIDTKVKEWRGDEKWEKYLRPFTLFGTKFESYLQQDGHAKVAPKKLTAEEKAKRHFTPREEV